MDSQLRCWSWSGVGGPCRLAVRAGQRTCVLHQEEEALISETLQRLGRLHDDILGLAKLSHPHLDAFKDLAEAPTRRFFREAIPEADVAVGYAHDDNSQRDIVLVDAQAGSLLSDRTVFLSGNAAEKLGHIEIKYSSRGRLSDLKKYLTQDLDRLHETLEMAARDNWSFKPWTGSVLLGPAWTEHRVALLQHIHEYYHERKATQVHSRKGAWWPIVDSVMFPGMWLKLTELHVQRSETSAKAPTFMMYCTSDGDPQAELRPLSIAAAMARHSVRYWKGLSQRNDALQVSEYSAACGPPGDSPINATTKSRTPFLGLGHGPDPAFNVIGQLAVEMHLDDALCCSQHHRILYGVSQEEEQRLEASVAGRRLKDL